MTKRRSRLVLNVNLSTMASSVDTDRVGVIPDILGTIPSGSRPPTSANKTGVNTDHADDCNLQADGEVNAMGVTSS